MIIKIGQWTHLSTEQFNTILHHLYRHIEIFLRNGKFLCLCCLVSPFLNVATLPVSFISVAFQCVGGIYCFGISSWVEISLGALRLEPYIFIREWKSLALSTREVSNISEMIQEKKFKRYFKPYVVYKVISEFLV